MNKGIFWSLLLFVLSPTLLFSQISTGGLPPSFSFRLKSVVKSEFIAKPNLAKLQAEDVVNDRLNKPYRVAELIDVDYCVESSGVWDTLSSGERVWRLQLYAPDAQGLQLSYSNFKLTPGVRLFIYNDDKSFVKGAFTENNNDHSGNFATEIIPGESCIVELALSSFTTEMPEFCISQVGYVYRGIDFFVPEGSRLKASGACQVDINCPEGNSWKDVKRAVARILMNGKFCTGTLINNTAQDFKNYFATAFHCIDGIQSTSANWIFYFNYERAGCNSTSNISPVTLTGASIRASTPIHGGGDGALLLLNGTIPASYKVYYAGWDRVESSISGGVSIHHPAGDRKKIATVRDKWYTTTWYGDNNTIGAKNAHWHLTFSQTPNGHSISEGGSSGSGIFGNDELFRGALSGGTSSCDIPSGSNLFGKLSYNWDKHGASPSTQYKTWLDPNNTGATRIKGIDPNDPAAFNVYWTSSPTNVEIDSFVQFRDETVGSGLTRKWTFSGGEPSTSTATNPLVKYSQSGFYDVSLEIMYNGVSYTKTRNYYVYVKAKSAWIIQNTRFKVPQRGIKGISIIDSQHVWAWAFDGIDPSNHILEYTVTKDGGKTWLPNSITADTLSGYGFGNIYALNTDTVYATIFGPNGGGKVIWTRDGGANWNVQTSATYNTPGGFPNYVYFFDKNNGIVCGDPTNGYFEIYRTSNSGASWNRVPKANVPQNEFGEAGTTNMYDAYGDTIWFGTSTGRVYRSSNRGLNWTVTKTGYNGQTTIRFRNSKVGFAIIVQSNNYEVRKTMDGGDTWQNYTLPSNFQKGDLAYIPGTKAAWLSVSSGFPSGSSFSTNDGANFTAIDVGIQYTSVSFYDPFTGWAGSFNKDSTFGGIYKWDKENPLLTDIRDNTVPVTETGIELFPNPIETMATISLKGDFKGGTAYIYNLQGKCLRTFRIEESLGSSTQQFDFSDLRAGMYILQIVDLKHTENIRFIKM